MGQASGLSAAVFWSGSGTSANAALVPNTRLCRAPHPLRLYPPACHPCSWLVDAASEAAEVGLMSSLLKLLRAMPLEAPLLEKSGG